MKSFKLMIFLFLGMSSAVHAASGVSLCSKDELSKIVTPKSLVIDCRKYFQKKDDLHYIALLEEIDMEGDKQTVVSHYVQLSNGVLEELFRESDDGEFFLDFFYKGKPVKLLLLDVNNDDRLEVLFRFYIDPATSLNVQVVDYKKDKISNLGRVTSFNGELEISPYNIFDFGSKVEVMGSEITSTRANGEKVIYELRKNGYLLKSQTSAESKTKK